MWLGHIKLSHIHCSYWNSTIFLNTSGCYKPKNWFFQFLQLFFSLFLWRGEILEVFVLISPNYWYHQITLLNVSFITMFAFLLQVFLLHRGSMFFKCLLYLIPSPFFSFLFFFKFIFILSLNSSFICNCSFLRNNIFFLLYFWRYCLFLQLLSQVLEVFISYLPAVCPAILFWLCEFQFKVFFYNIKILASGYYIFSKFCL